MFLFVERPLAHPSFYAYASASSYNNLFCAFHRLTEGAFLKLNSYNL
jgi:hypothetical protein